MPPIIEVEHLSRTFVDSGVATHALREATFTISQGEFVAIMGASGSGKSTLLHILGLLDQPSGGRYLLSGRDTSKLSDQQRAAYRNEKIGFVFQSFHLLPRATVLENVLLPLFYSKIAQSKQLARAQTAIKQVELTHRLDYQPSQLSGGEKQRVAIARALVNKPSIIFADEPTGNLDSKTGQTVMALIDDLHQSGHTIIVITHELTVAQFAQRIITIKDGAVISDKPVTKPHGHRFNK